MPEKIVTDEQEDLTWKLIIEAALILAFGKLFRRIAVDFMTVYSATGQIPDADIYKPETTGILTPAYISAGSTSGRELRSNTELNFPTGNGAQTEEEIAAAQLAFSNEAAEASSDIITATTNRQLHNFALSAIIGAAIAGFYPSNADIAKVAAGRFASGITSRSRVIGMREGLNAVEGARSIEATGLIQGGAEIKINDAISRPLSGVLFKEWISRRDRFVRLTHVLADGQRVEGVETPFIVGNSLLLYPGDTSLGASTDEISGCRCYAATGIKS